MSVENLYNDVIHSDAFEVCKEVKTILEKIQLTSDIDNDQMFDIKVILCELLQNAIQHGNDCDRKKKIHLEVSLREGNSILEISVTDQGCGFSTLKTADFGFDELSESDPMNISESGRGLFIVQNLSDCMEFSSSKNTITIKKKLTNVLK